MKTINMYNLCKVAIYKKLSESLIFDFFIASLINFIFLYFDTFLLLNLYSILLVSIFVYNLFEKKEEIILYVNLPNKNIRLIRLLNNFIYLMIINISCLGLIFCFNSEFCNLISLNIFLFFYFIVGEFLFNKHLILKFKTFHFQFLLSFLSLFLLTPMLIVFFKWKEYLLLILILVFCLVNTLNKTKIEFHKFYK